jgi:N-acetylglucosamine-6-sulfatase
VDLKLPPESDTWNTFTNNHPFVGALLPMNFLYRNYCECVVSVDEQVGRLLAKLEEMRILDDTVIIYAGDNGHLWGEHGLYDKRVAYEESIRIPFMIRYPDAIQDPGRRAGQMALNIDLAPTILDLAGISVPSQMQGQSLVPILRSPAAAGRSSWLYEHFPVFPIPIPGMTAVRTQTHKYVEYHNDVRPRQLFDLSKDPREKKNLMNTAEGKKLSIDLKDELEYLKKTTQYRYFTHG